MREYKNQGKISKTSERILRGFFNSFLNGKLSFLPVCVILLTVTPVWGFELSSVTFRISGITFFSGSGSSSSSGNSMQTSSIGEGLVTAGGITNSGTIDGTGVTGETVEEEAQSTQMAMWVGQTYVIAPWLEPGAMKLISGLKARTDILGPAIPEATWQKDNDPYFYWLIIIEPATFITGFSISLDTYPDETIDTMDAVYQFPAESISSGEHIFYVLPFVPGNMAKPESLLQFALWVDTDPPNISQLVPASGEVLTNNTFTVSCGMDDQDSGLDIGATVLTINEQQVAYTYMPETKTLTYVPASAYQDGKVSILLKAFDVMGNSIAKAWDVVVDTEPPAGSILLNNGEDTTHSAYVSIAINVQDGVSGVKSMYISNDGIFDTELQHPYSYKAVITGWLVNEPDLDGKKTVYLKFEDEAGNFSASIKDDIVLRLLTPDTRIISGPSTSTQETTAEFTFEATKENCLFSYRFDNLEWSEWRLEQAAQTSGLAGGNHYFYVKSAYDLNGDEEITIDEEDATPAHWSWTVQTQAEGEGAEDKILFWKR
ncbi:MAG: hypothetical protein KKC84_05580 [Candidatus Omnitrophica bacterium]|nr:hypothetical protein [Candidatus Omnitrophota bacterium]